MDRSPSTLRKEIADRLASFQENLPRALDPIALSSSKLPFKALDYRETLIWRVTELAQSALETLDQERFASAMLLTRAVVETVAALWYLSKKVGFAVDNDKLGDIDDYLMKLSLGHRKDDEFPQAINVTTFVDHVDKEIPGFRRQYDELSEYAHPNYLGTTGLYSHRDHQAFTISYGEKRGAKTAALSIGITNLSVALMLFEHTYNKLGGLMPAFITLCEKSSVGLPSSD